MRKMMFILFPVVLFLIVISGSWSMATADDSIDMAEYTCGDLMEEDRQNVALILMWVDGYISSETQDMTISREWMVEMATKINASCTGNPDTLLIDVVEKLAAEN